MNRFTFISDEGFEALGLGLMTLRSLRILSLNTMYNTFVNSMKNLTYFYLKKAHELFKEWS